MSKITVTFAIGGTVDINDDPNDLESIVNQIMGILATHHRDNNGKLSPVIWEYESIVIDNAIDPSKVYDCTLPEWSLSYLINGDKSDLTEDEINLLNNFVGDLPANGAWGSPSEPYFARGNDITSTSGNVVDIQYITQ